MLKLINISKDYNTGGNVVHALRNVNLEFRKNEFVSVLGPSGCGKTTMLNIIGGLDKYTAGDLQVNGKTTKDFRDGDWDAYRNSIIGMVFQNYNLIAHLSVLENVSIALTLSGVSMTERKERAKKALIDVGLEDQISKKPNQLSGGQMQRVAIARALVNNPEILLADEPTGALDTKTSVQIMELLKIISQDRLVIMVTHNEKLAEAYSDRLIKLVDGEVLNDSKTYSNGDKHSSTANKLRSKKTAMSFFTAIKHSFMNLMTKKKRTIITSIAGSIGIIGIALVLSISNGMSNYMSTMQSDTLAGFPITISPTTSVLRQGGFGGLLGDETATEFPDDGLFYSYSRQENISTHKNVITQEYISFLDDLDVSLYNQITYTHGIEMNVLVKSDSGNYTKVSTESGGGMLGLGGGSAFSELPNNRKFVESQYDLVGGAYPEGALEAALVVDSYNRLDISLLNQYGINISETYSINDLVGRTFKVIPNNVYYNENDSGIFTAGNDYEVMYNNPDNFTVAITGILRIKESASSDLLSSGVSYTKALTDALLTLALKSDIAIAQTAAGTTNNVLTGLPFNQQVTYESVILKIGADSNPTGLQIYPKDFESKEKIKTYLDGYNEGKAKENRIEYTDLADTISSMTSTLLDTITIVLAAFAAISLVVSSIMIGIITYVSVVERTKEIGILRAIGARKRDISRLFNAETIIIGFVAGTLGILITLLLNIPVNAIVGSLAGVAGIASLNPLHAIALIAVSIILTLIAGLIPSRIAAKKDPVVALRTE